MKVKKKGIILLCCCALLSSCVNAIMTGANVIYNHNNLQHTVSDYYIMLQIRRTMDNDPWLNRTSIAVTSFNHIVLLTGEVYTAALQQRAGNIASQVEGVKRVFNALSVHPPLSTAEMAQDTWITAVIKAKIIASNGTTPDKIKVVTENGVVYLLGIVPRQQADIAIRLASNTYGVKKVVTLFYYIIMPEIN